MAQGPFEKGATVSVYELDENFEETGVHIDSKTSNDSGAFSIKIKDFKSQYALFKVNGRYIDNITGAKSADSITLYAFTDLNKYDKININFLTHLSHKRILYLVTKKDKSVDKASMQAETEVLRAFDIENDGFDDAENIDIFGKNKQSAALLAISALIQGNLLKAKLNDRLTDFVSDIEKYGTWDNEQTKTEIADWASNVSLNTGFDKVKGYIKKWNQTVDLSAFEKYVENFWQQNYSLGECSDKNQNEIRGNGNELSNFRHFICRSNKWILDNDPANDGDTRWVTWVNPNGYGKSKSCEVYDDTTWRDGESNECGSGFGGCTKKRETKKIYHSDGYYICQNKAWMWVSVPIDSINPEMNIENESDTLGWKDTTEGAIRKGNITDVIYIFDNKQWRVATLPEASLGGCNEKTENIFGYVEMRIWQNFIPPTWFECKKNSDECPNATYSPGYYICKKNYDKKFYWSGLGVSYYNHLCNDSSYYANSKEGDAHWGSIEPIKKKCINCKQENIDYLENICKKRCYVHDGTNRYYLGVQKIGNGWRIGHASECALGFGGCTESRFGTIKEGPVFKAEVSSDYLGYELYIMYSYVTSIDSIKKRPYICRYPYSEGLDEFPTEWYIASDIDIELAPKLCDNWWGILISGKNNNKYVCDLDGFRLATQEEIEVGIACTEYNMYVLEKCSSELEKETGMTCTEYMRLVEKCRTKQKKVSMDSTALSNVVNNKRKT
ncbi:hypothetical protein [Fibrobacter sp.]|uniref:hypothetical protein n=1 Tax=Fibrobacter sp. TaxID=35828 RepID=UPI0025BD0627|nr:hypothetical protein [Fibrobacter sp.]MBR3071548.1 hypothetical protein [Fibrobacter sp.]